MVMMTACGNDEGSQFHMDSFFINTDTTDVSDVEPVGSGTTNNNDDTPAPPVEQRRAETPRQEEEPDNSHMPEGHAPGEDIIVPDENIAAIEEVRDRMSGSYTGIQETTQELGSNFDLIITDDGIISIMYSLWGELQGVFYDFDIDPEIDTLESVQARIATFTSTVTGIETTGEHMNEIMRALHQVHVDMTDAVWLIIEGNVFSIGIQGITMTVGW